MPSFFYETLMSKKYKIVFHGKIVSGYDLKTVKNNLAKAFKKDLAMIEGYFQGKEFILADQVDYETAEKIERLLKSKGALCEIVVLEDIPEIKNNLTVVKRENFEKEEDKTTVEEEEQNIEAFSFQFLVLRLVSIIVRSAWSFTVGIPFFVVGLLLFVITEIILPESDISYKILTNMYKWGSCHWFKQVRLETDDYDVDVKKHRKS